MRVTIKDVADKAGVATSTVSRVMHDNPRISEETQKKVRAAMDELGYHPNAMARNLARGKTHTLGLIIPSSEDNLFIHPFFINAMRGLSIEAQKKGYNIMYSFSASEQDELSFIKTYVRKNLVDGIILTVSRQEDKCMAYLETKKFPYVVIGRPDARHERALWVDNDNFQAMYNMVTYLLNKGKSRIAFFGGSEDFFVTQDRLRGYREALRTHGIPLDDELVFFSHYDREEYGYRNTAALLENKSIDAVAAADDTHAIGALNKMKETGEYFHVAGFNNSPKGQFITPGLTSVDVQPVVLGAKAAELLIHSLETEGEDNSPRYSIVDTKLVERESTDDEFIRSSHETYL